MWLLYIVIGLISLVIVGIVGLNIFVQLQRKRELQFAHTIDQADTIDDPILADIDPNQPALLYFTSPMCAPCKTMQRPAITRLQALMPDLPIITIDIMESPEIAERWHVMSLPRTFVIGKNRQVSATNIDVATTDVLHTQIESAMMGTANNVQVTSPAKKGFGLPKIALKTTK